MLKHFFPHKKLYLVVVLLFFVVSFSAEAGGAFIHRVTPGESLFSVAQNYEITLHELLDTNTYIRNPDRIYPGQLLVIPGLAEQGETTPSPPPPVEPRIQPTIAQLLRIYSDRFFLKETAGTAHNRVALTFDDGPDGTYTPMVLDVLKTYDVPATFFLVGKNVEKHPEVTRRIIAEGHVVGNHSWSHPNLRFLKPGRLESEIKWTEDILEQATGLRTMLMRPPYGGLDLHTLEQLIEMDYYIINWSVDSLDWRELAVDPILINTLTGVEEGAIILFHTAGGQDLSPTAAALPELIETLRMQGYTFVTVDELLQIPAYRD